MRIKDINIKEDATPGATTSGNIAILAGPALKNSRGIAYTGSPSTGSGKKAPTPWMPKQQKPTDNALDGDLLLADKQPNIIRRQIKEGSLYEYGENAIKHCVRIAKALGDDVSHCYPKKPKEDKPKKEDKKQESVPSPKKSDGDSE